MDQVEVLSSNLQEKALEKKSLFFKRPNLRFPVVILSLLRLKAIPILLTWYEKISSQTTKNHHLKLL